MTLKKLDQIYPGLSRLKEPTTETPPDDDPLDEEALVEMAEEKEVRENFKRYLNFDLYEQFFRGFCRNPYVEYSYSLRADYQSFSKGL